MPNEFMQALRNWGKEPQRHYQTGSIGYHRIKNPPPVLWMHVNRSDCLRDKDGNLIRDKDGTLIYGTVHRPVDIPLEFELPQEIMMDPKPIKYKLIGGINYRGAPHSGHYIAYIATKNGFIECNDDFVTRMGTQEGLDTLKGLYWYPTMEEYEAAQRKAGGKVRSKGVAHLVAYERQD
jgi:hypothetical protein